MVLSRLRKISEKILKPAANFAIKIGITPNMATFLAFLVSIIAAGLIFLYPIWNYILIFSAGLIFLSGYFDALDGAIARNSYRITKFGGFLDSVLDRYADAIMIGCLILVGYPTQILCVTWIGLVALIGSLLVSYTRARAESAGATNGKKMAVGIAERSERMIILMIVFVLQGFPELSLTTNPLLNYTGIGMIILAVLTHITVIQRIIHAYRVLPEVEQKSKDEEKASSPEEKTGSIEEIITRPAELTSSPEEFVSKPEKIIS
ncbi:MAG: CDP-alcohol phosphatidyltransferase family protein [Candidatus Helarchaeota archaeon]|nr:CDP-alcohol phosphatidyltransferase family protein [Candidatus Helarchaeota archaeon]